MDIKAERERQEKTAMLSKLYMKTGTQPGRRWALCRSEGMCTLRGNEQTWVKKKKHQSPAVYIKEKRKAPRYEM